LRTAGRRRGRGLKRPDTATEEQNGSQIAHVLPRPVGVAPAGLHAPEVEDALAFEEEVALFGKEQIEAGEVHLLLIPPALVDHHALRMAVPAARRNVNALGVEEDPGLGLLGRRPSLVRFLLNEIAHRRDPAIDFFFQYSVDHQGMVEADRPQGDPPLLVAGDDRRRDRGRRPVDGQSRGVLARGKAGGEEGADERQ
jgi:hypothetical protein